MDLLSIEETETYLGIPSGSGGNFLSTLITDVSAWMAQFTGRNDWGASTSRTEYHHGGKSWIAPKYWPIASVTSINDDPQHDFGSGTVVGSTTYFISGESDGMIWTEGFTFAPGRENLKLVYTAGYASTGAVPADIKYAAKLQIKHERDMVRSKGRAEDLEAGTLLPPVQRMLMHHTRKIPFA